VFEARPQSLSRAISSRHPHPPQIIMNSRSSSYLTRIGVSVLLAGATALGAQTKTVDSTRWANSTNTGSAAATENTTPTHDLTSFEVSAGSNVGYRALSSIGATRYESLVRDLPIAVNVVTSEFIEDAGFQYAEEALAYTAGFNNRTSYERNTFGGTNATLRGHASQFSYRNGFIHYHKTDPITTDRIEVVKGPAGMNYGSVYPGGVVNILTKKPLPVTQTLLTTTVGDGYFRGGIDHNQVLVSDKLSLRLIGGYVDRDSFIRDAGSTFSVFYPALRWTPNPNTRLDITYERKNEQNTEILNVVRDAQGLPIESLGRRFNVHSGDIPVDATVQTFNIDFTQRFNDVVSMRIGFEAFRRESTPSFALIVSDQLRNRVAGGPVEFIRIQQVAQNRDGGYDNGTGQVDLLAEFPTAIADVKSKISYERRESISYGKGFRRPDVTPTNPLWINVFAPREDRRVIDPAAQYTIINRNQRRYQNFYSWTWSNTLTALDKRLNILAAIRDERIVNDDRELDPVTGGRRMANGGTQTFSKLNPQLGVSYRINDTFTAYTSYSTGQRPNSVRDANGFLNPPETSEGFDVGMKFELKGGRIFGTLAYFEIVRDGVYRRDTERELAENRTPFYTISGEEFSRGLELDLVASPTDNIQLISGIAWTDAYVQTSTLPAGDPANNQGIRLPYAPKWQFSQFVRYSFTDGWLNRSYISVGGRYRSDVNESVTASQRNRISPSHAVFDVNIGTTQAVFGQEVRFSLDLRNVLDREYRIGATWAEPFSAYLTASTRF